MEGNRIGIVGGGQLGRMLTLAAKPFGFEVMVLDPGEDCPAAQVGAEQLTGDLKDAEAIKELGSRVGVITIEIEHINVDALEEVAESGTEVHPVPSTLKTIQDKLYQKTFLREHGLPVADFMPLDEPEELDVALQQFNSLIVKTRYGGYDGRGNMVVDHAGDWTRAREKFGSEPLYVEELVSFQKELAVIAARDIWGNITTYPVVETFHANNICEVVLAPADIRKQLQREAESLARETLCHLEGAGIFGIEMFLDEQDNIMINEIAPRVHNSGHHTIEANRTSQFEQHIRAVTGLPLGSTEMISPSAMVNIIGKKEGPLRLDGLVEALAGPDTKVHIYGKTPRVSRKIGHITVMAGTTEQAKLIALRAREELAI